MSRNHAARRANELPQKALLRLPGNDKCADCLARGPVWASINLGVFICIQCSGMHRRLGTHISKVRSISSDEWKPEWVELLRKIGNDVAAHFYEHDPIAQELRFVASESSLIGGDRMQLDAGRRLEVWIRAKYEYMKFAKPNADPPHVICQRGDDPRHIYGLPRGGSGQRTPVSPVSSPSIKGAPSAVMRHSPRGERDVKLSKGKKEKKDKGVRIAAGAGVPAFDFDDMFAQMSTGIGFPPNGEMGRVSTDVDTVSFAPMEPLTMQHPFIQSPVVEPASPSHAVHSPMNAMSSPQLNHGMTPTPMGPRGILSTPYDDVVNEIGRPHSDIGYNPTTESINIHVSPYPDHYSPKQQPRNLIDMSTPNLQRSDRLHVNDVRNGRASMSTPHFGREHERENREHKRDDREHNRDDREHGFLGRPVVEMQELPTGTTASKKEAQWLKQITSPKTKKHEKLIAKRQRMIMDSIRMLYTDPGRLGLRPGLYSDIRPYGYSVSRGIFSISMLLDKEGKGPPRRSSPTSKYNGMLALTDGKRPDPVPEPIRLDSRSREILRELDQLTRVRRVASPKTDVRRDELGIRMGSTVVPDPQTIWEERQRNRRSATTDMLRTSSPPSSFSFDRHIAPGPIYRIERPSDNRSSAPASPPPARRSSQRSSGQESVVDRIMGVGSSDAISRRHGTHEKGVRSDTARDVPLPVRDYSQFQERPVDVTNYLAPPRGESPGAPGPPPMRKPVLRERSGSPRGEFPRNAVPPAVRKPVPSERSGSPGEHTYSIRQVPLNAAYRLRQPRSVSPLSRSISPQRVVASTPQRVVASPPQRVVPSPPQRVVESPPQRVVASPFQPEVASSPKVQIPPSSILDVDRLSTVATQLEEAAMHMSAIETHLVGISPPTSPILVAAMDTGTTTAEDVDNMDLSSVLLSLGEAAKHMDNLNPVSAQIDAEYRESGSGTELGRLSYHVSVISPEQEVRETRVSGVSGGGEKRNSGGTREQYGGDDDRGVERRSNGTLLTQHDVRGDGDGDRRNNGSTRERQGENNKYLDAGSGHRSSRDDSRKYVENTRDSGKKHEDNMRDDGRRYQSSNRDDGRRDRDNTMDDERRYVDATRDDGRKYVDAKRDDDRRYVDAKRDDDRRYVDATRDEGRGYRDNMRDGGRGYQDTTRDDGRAYRDNRDDGRAYRDNRDDGTAYRDNRDDGRAYRDNRDDGRRYLEASRDDGRRYADASRDDGRRYADTTRDDRRGYQDTTRDDGRAYRDNRDSRDDSRGYLDGSDREYARHHLHRHEGRDDGRYYSSHDDARRRDDFRHKYEDIGRRDNDDDRRAYSPPHKSCIPSSPAVSSTKLSDRYGRLEDAKRDLELSGADMGLLDMAIISQDLARLEAKAARI